MKAAVRTLARGWRRGALRWYVGTAAVLGLSITLLLVVSGLFAGMEHETRERVADFYTHDVRVTAIGTSAIPPREFFDLNATVAALAPHANSISVHYESQAILSRRAFLDAALTEDEQFQVGAGGREGDGDEVIALGALIGIESDGADRDELRKHLVSGSLPGRGTGTGSMPLVLSLDRLDQFLTASERQSLPWPPRISDLRDISFEVTAARVVESSDGQARDVIRRPAHIVGLYDSGVDVLDAFTYIAPIEDVRQLNEHDPDAPVANVLVLETDDADGARRVAEREGWTVQGAAAFTDRYLGQLIAVLQVLSVLVSVFLFMLPAFLIVHGVGRQLETHNREIAVCHAIGVRPNTVRQALGQVVVQVSVVAVALAAVLTTLLGLLLHWVLPPRRDLPLPMDFQITAVAVVLALSVTLISVLAALWIAFRSQARQDLSSTLRTF